MFVTASNAPKSARILGLVSGSTVRTRHVGIDLMASVRAVFGGEVTGLSTLLEEARAQSLQRLLDDASRIGATQVHNLRISTSPIKIGSLNATEVLCYGSASE